MSGVSSVPVQDPRDAPRACPCPCHGGQIGCEHCLEADHDLIEALSEAERLIRVFYDGEADAATIADAKAWLMEGR